MQQCCGITKKGIRCSNNGKYGIAIAGTDFDVCKIHDKKNILSGWEKEINKRLKNNSTDLDDVPLTVLDWLHGFNECHAHTKNLFVSSRYATIMRHTRLIPINFNQKFDIYVNLLVTELPSGGTCCVCYDEDDIMKTECGHEICLPCVKEWMYRSVSCPVCRTIL